MTRPSKDKAIQRLQRALDAIENLKQQQHRSSSPEFHKWHRNTKIAIAHTFGQDSSQVEEFTTIRYIPSAMTSSITDSDYQRRYISGLESATSVLESMIEEVEEYWEDDSLIGVSTSDKKVSPEHLRDVFIIHGRDEGTKETVARFISQLQLNPIILHEQPNQGQTIIEKFERHAEVAFAIALLTPDDTGGLAGEEQSHKPRARQNVIFELGYFTGKLDRGQVCALKGENVEIPSDYDGVLYIPFDESGGWKMTLMRELKIAGFEVDVDRVLE
ncbi:MAG: nucleotide-binding protein [Gemmatimonadetes bacterium]|nr:nucleotide-binding protein [Gemmatimonadota bacterium]